MNHDIAGASLWATLEREDCGVVEYVPRVRRVLVFTGVLVSAAGFWLLAGFGADLAWRWLTR